MTYCLDDAFFAKLALDGSALTYATFMGGTTSDYATGVAVDGAGNAYVSGRTDSCNSVDYFDIVRRWFVRWGECVARREPSLLHRATYPRHLRRCQRVHGARGRPRRVRREGEPDRQCPCRLRRGPSPAPTRDESTAIAVSSDGTAYVAGTTYSLNFIGTPSPLAAFQPAMTAGNCNVDGCRGDAFVARLDTTGAIAWWTYPGGDDSDDAFGMADQRDLGLRRRRDLLDELPDHRAPAGREHELRRFRAQLHPRRRADVRHMPRRHGQRLRQLRRGDRRTGLRRWRHAVHGVPHAQPAPGQPRGRSKPPKRAHAPGRVRLEPQPDGYARLLLLLRRRGLRLRKWRRRFRQQHLHRRQGPGASCPDAPRRVDDRGRRRRVRRQGHRDPAVDLADERQRRAGRSARPSSPRAASLPIRSQNPEQRLRRVDQPGDRAVHRRPHRQHQRRRAGARRLRRDRDRDRHHQRIARAHPAERQRHAAWHDPVHRDGRRPAVLLQPRLERVPAARSPRRASTPQGRPPTASTPCASPTPRARRSRPS